MSGQFSGNLVTTSEIESTQEDLRALQAEVHTIFDQAMFDGCIERLDEFRATQEAGTEQPKTWRNHPGLKYKQELQIVKDTFPVDSPRIFAVGHGPDVSHCLVYADAGRIFNLDLDPSSVEMMRERFASRPEVKSYLGVVQSFRPPEDVDICFAVGVRFDESEFDYRSFLKPGGLILTNANFPWFFVDAPDIRFEGVTVAEVGSFSRKRLKPPVERSIETEKDLLRAGLQEGFADFATVYRAVYELQRTTDNLLQRYALLRDQAAEDTLDSIRIGLLRQDRVFVRDKDWKQRDVFSVEDRAHMKEMLIKHAPLTLRRNLDEYVLPPLPKSYTIGPRTYAFDLEVFRYCP